MGKHDSMYSKGRVTGRKGKTSGDFGIRYHIGLDGVDDETWWCCLDDNYSSDEYFDYVVGNTDNFATWWDIEEEVRQKLGEKEYTFADLLDNVDTVYVSPDWLNYYVPYNIVRLTNTRKVLNILGKLNNKNRELFLKELEERPETTYMIYDFKNYDHPWVLYDDEDMYVCVINSTSMFGILYENFYAPENTQSEE